MLQELLVLCKNRHVLFDNRTKDESKRVQQVQQLFSLVNKVISHNGGQPYTDELFAELKVILLTIFRLVTMYLRKFVNKFLLLDRKELQNSMISRRRLIP